ncbi:Hypothetical protein CINCED_3A007422, partial [Cinara cedri]
TQWQKTAGQNKGGLTVRRNLIEIGKQNNELRKRIDGASCAFMAFKDRMRRKRR